MVRARRQRERNSDSDGDGEFAELDPHSKVAKVAKKKKKKQKTVIRIQSKNSRSNKLTFNSQIKRLKQHKDPEPLLVWTCLRVVYVSCFAISAACAFYALLLGA